MKFAPIIPIDFLTERVFNENSLMGIVQSDCNLVLAHMIEESKRYTDMYRLLSNPVSRPTIMDNSAFEMYTQNKPLFPAEKLLNLAQEVRAQYIVLPDYPGESSLKTMDAAKLYAEQYKEAGFKTFFVPQSEIGDIEQWISSFAWAVSSPLVDYIGISIIAVPNAYSIERNKLQNFVSRYMLMSELDKRGYLKLARTNKKKIHMLGMNEGPNEIKLMNSFIIDSWDSSAPAWAGLNGIKFDGSPTGLVNGKFHLPVDFSFKTEDNYLIDCAKYNLQYINKLVKDYNAENEIW